MTGMIGALPLRAATPALTTVNDIVYRADGMPASGTVIISWPAFTSADGAAVAAGNKTVVLEAAGALSVQLVPNAGATPGGTYYVVVYQLNDNTVRTEYWSVPATSPTTIAAVRSTPGAGASTSQIATRQYVDTAVAGRASDASVVHVNGTETISGAKQFLIAPSVPAPVAPSDATNKEYVDGVVSNSGSGSYIRRGGDTMTGPLTLAGDPVAPLQAATQRYVENALAGKADLEMGLIPASELGRNAADAALCLRGDSSWGACGGNSNAVSIMDVPVDPSAPTDQQVLTYESTTGKYKPKSSTGNISSIFGRTGVVTAQTGDYSVGQITGAEAASNKGVAGGYASLDASGRVPVVQIPGLAESQITGLTTDLASKLGNSGAQTLAGDLTATGKVAAATLQTTGTGGWTVEGAYGNMTAAASSNSKLGFGTGGKLSVSENAGPVTEVAKKGPQQFTYTFFDPNNTLTMGLQVSSIYVNRATAIHVTEVYCEVDGGSATVNIQNSGATVLTSDLACSSTGAASTSFINGRDAVAAAAKIGHVTASVSGVHRMSVVVKYSVD